MTEENTKQTSKKKGLDLGDNVSVGCVSLIVVPVVLIAVLGIIESTTSGNLKREVRKTPGAAETTGVLSKETIDAENTEGVEREKMEESIRAMLLTEAQGIMRDVEKYTDEIQHLDLDQIETSLQRDETLKAALSVSERGIAEMTEMEKSHRAGLKKRNMEYTQWTNETSGLFNTSLDYCKNARDAAKSWQAFFDGADRKNLNNALESYSKMQDNIKTYNKHKRVIDSFVSKPGGPWLIVASFSNKDMQKEYKALREGIE